jgi:hypothetical protein
MNDSSAAKLPTTTAAKIRRAAAIVAPVMGMCVVVLAVIFGRRFDEAALMGCIAAATGMMVWSIYHLVSRRNDGLILILLACMPYLLVREDNWLSAVVAALGVYVPFTVLLGTWARNWRL